jgi:hypothetical protein
VTLPNGAAGLNPNNVDGVTSDGSIPAQANNDQSTVTDTLKSRYIGTTGSGTSVFTNPSGPLGAVCSLIAGNPFLSGISDLGTGDNLLTKLVDGMQQLANMFEGLGTGTTITGSTPTSLFGAAGGGLDSFVGLFGGSGTGNPLTALFTQMTSFFTNLGNLFGGADFGSGSFDAFSTMGTFVESIFNPSGTTTQLSSVASLNGRVSVLEAGSSGGTGIFDNFNRGSIGSNWTAVTGSSSIAIVSGDYIQNSGSRGASYYSASTLSTDKQRVQATVGTVLAGRASLFICGDPALANYCCLDIDMGLLLSATVAIKTGTSVSSMTTRASTTLLPFNNDVFGIDFDGVDTFTAYRNSAVLFTWQDTGAVVTHGSGHREVGIISNSGNSGLITFGIGYTDFTAFDW